MSTNRIIPVLAMLGATLISCCAPKAECWPDGSKLSGWFSQEPSAPKGKQAREFCISSYGAVADSTIVQTAAIQKTIDAAAQKGGTVVIPEGTWLSGALFFKPGTHLLLEEGAVLKGSTDLADYPDIPVHIEGVLQTYVSALVNADGCRGFSIRGKGTIDGSGLPYWEAFWARRKENPACTNL
ncbi:MAG: exopolygalacturonase, partial [Bacteroidales bacterium]|nr:exopolygalacturonase [Bacteroidales bacterium]